MEKETDVAIIGGGAIGICCAYYLWQQGRTVTVLEKGEIGAGCSDGNAGLIVPSHVIPLAAPGVIAQGLKWLFNPESPFYIKPRLRLDLLSWLWKFRGACNEAQMHAAIPVLRDLSLASVDLFEQLASLEGVSFAFQQNGLFMLFNSEKYRKDNQKMVDLAQGAGLDASMLTSDEVREIEPNLQSPITGGAYYRQDCHLDPALFIHALRQYLQAQGVTFYTDTEVRGLEQKNGQITSLTMSRRSLRAQEVVLAAGSWSPQLARDIGVKLPVQPAKGYSVTFDQPERPLRVPFLLSEAKVAVTPMADKLRFAGTLELAGLDPSINRRRAASILHTIPQYLPHISPESIGNAEIWSGYRPCTPDGLPFVGRPRRYANLTIATGHAMIGITLGPITGKLVSEIICDGMPSMNLTALHPERFN